MTTNNVNEVIEDIIRKPKVIMCMDSCIYLDFFNNAMDTAFIKNLNKLEEIVKRDEMYLIVPSIVLEEFKRNLETVCNRLKDIVTKNIGLIKAVQELLIVFNRIDRGDIKNSLPPHLCSPELTLETIDILKDKVEALIVKGRVVSSSKELDHAAFNRMRSCIRPAQRGKASHGDCLIIETVLSVAKGLRDKSFNEKIMFVTSNVEDFGGETVVTRRKLHPEIERDFLPLRISFYSHINHAVAKIFSG